MTRSHFDVPEGWQLVPIAPTPEMLAFAAKRGKSNDPALIWTFMLGAAPPPPDRYRALVQRADRATEAEISKRGLSIDEQRSLASALRRSSEHLYEFEYDTGRIIPREVKP